MNYEQHTDFISSNSSVVMQSNHSLSVLTFSTRGKRSVHPVLYLGRERGKERERGREEEREGKSEKEKKKGRKEGGREGRKMKEESDGREGRREILRKMQNEIMYVVYMYKCILTLIQHQDTCNYTRI